MMRNFSLLLLFGVALQLAGCNQKNASNPVDTKPFEAAIADYCQSKGFGMKVGSVDRINVKGDTATAACAMEEAEGTYGIKVRWNFTFRHSDSGWRVENHTAK